MKRSPLLVVGLIMLGPELALAAGSPTVELKFSLQDTYISGAWNQAQITVHNPGPAFTGEVQVDITDAYAIRPGSPPISSYSLPGRFPTGDTKLDLALSLPLFSGPLRLRLLDGRGHILFHDQKQLEAMADEAYYPTMVISHRPERIRAALATSRKPLIIQPDTAPTDARAYDGVNVLVLDNFALTELAPEVVKAILQWTGAGGNLILSAPFLELNRNNRELARFTSAGIGPAGTCQEPSALAQLISENMPPTISSARVLACRVPPDTVMAAAGDQPLMYAQQWGRGQVIGLTTDPSWVAAAVAADGVPFARSFWSSVTQNWARPARYYKYSSVPGPLVPARLRTWRAGQPLIWYLIAFVLVMGPLNLLVLHLRRRREWLALTAPLIVVAFLIIAVILALTLHPRSSSLTFSSISLGEGASSGLASTNYLGLWSTGASHLSLTFTRPDPLVYEFHQSQIQSLLNPPNFVSVADRPLSISPLQIPRWSMRWFAEKGYSEVGQVHGALTVDGHGLHGYVENGLPIELHNCYLLDKWHHVALGDLPRGVRKLVALPLGPPVLSAYRLARVDSLMGLDGWIDENLWGRKLKGADWELVRLLSDQQPYLRGEPMLIGWGKAVSPAPSLNLPQYRYLGSHLYVIRLPVTAAGPEVTIPFGGSLVSRAGPSEWLLARRTGASHQAQLSAFAGAIFYFVLPLPPGHVHHDRLQIAGHMSETPGEGGLPATRLELYDWQHSKWAVLTSKVKRHFKLTVPTQYIYMPRGLVMVRLATGDDSWDRWLADDVTWLGLAYHGEVIGQ